MGAIGIAHQTHCFDECRGVLGPTDRPDGSHDQQWFCRCVAAGFVHGRARRRRCGRVFKPRKYEGELRPTRIHEPTPTTPMGGACQSIDWRGIRIHHTSICKLLNTAENKRTLQILLPAGSELNRHITRKDYMRLATFSQFTKLSRKFVKYAGRLLRKSM